MTVNVNEIPLDPSDESKTAWGANVADHLHFTWAIGDSAAESFDATTDISTDTRDLMVAHESGVYVDLGAGNDTAVGSDYGDNFIMGAGVNYVDGGANTGTTPWGDKARDVLDVLVTDAAAASAVQVTVLSGGGDAADIAAYGDGYTAKVVAGSEITYVKGIEGINVQIWNDGNTNGQKDWGNGEVSFVRHIPISLNISEIQLNPTDPTKTAWGAKVADQHHLAWVNGTQSADSFTAGTDISADTRALMDLHDRGVYVDLGAGGDTAVGSDYGDNFIMGAGVNYVDGGANTGKTPWGDKARDVVEIFVANQAAANAVTVTTLDGGGDATDASAYTAGYTAKVVSGSEITYIKNVEAVNVQIWNDGNTNGQRDWDSGEITFARSIPVTVNVNEIQLNPTDATKTAWGAKVADQHHLAWVNGTQSADSFAAGTDISADTRALMDLHDRGVYVDLGAGGDTAVGSDYGDNFIMGAGVNYVDGGANTGKTPWGDKARDVVEIFVANQAEANAVSVTRLSGAGDATDTAAYAAGYTAKVIAGSETTYVKNVEAVSVQIWNDGNGNSQRDWESEVSFGRFIPLEVSVDEIRLNPTDNTKTAWGANVADQLHLAWVNGTQGGDNFVADATTISADTLALMDQHERGLNVELGAGNDTAVGTAYGDNFIMGAGVNYVDGGANTGKTPWGNKASDSLDIFVADQAAANAVAVTALTGGGDASDVAAFASGYTAKVVSGSETTYLKNIEGINIQIWNDGDGNGQRDWGTEVTPGRYIALAVNIGEIQLNPTDTTKTTWGANVADQHHFAWVNGTQGSDNFVADATTISDGTRALMDLHDRGVYVEMGAGNDMAVGSDYGDNFIMGTGVNYVDGGANTGKTPWGDKARDVVEIFVANQAAADAVAVTTLSGAGDATDAAAYSAGYTAKVVAGSETTYVKNVEAVSVQVWNDGNGNGQREWETEVTPARFIPLQVSVDEIRLNPTDNTKTAWGAQVADQHHLAWVNGTLGADNFVADATTISAETLALMSLHKRGLNLDLGAGNDTAAGTAYGDNFTMGSGVNYVDGGDNTGKTPWGNKATDSLDIFVADQAAANAVAVTALTGGGDATDVAAFTSGYTAKVVSGSETTYLKNIEGINVQIWNDGNGNGQRDWNTEVTPGRYIAMALNISEIQLNPTDNTKTAWGAKVADQHHLAWANGTEGADNFTTSTDISTDTLALMDQHGRGLYVDLGAGDDRATGSAYGDNFTMGSGVNYVDGGAQGGTTPWGNNAQDAVDIYVSDAAALNALTLTVLDGSGSATDSAAFADGYTTKVVSGDETTYMKNVEAVNVQFWNDTNGNGQRDFNTGEITQGRYINLVPTISENTADHALLLNSFHMGWAYGTDTADTVDLRSGSSMISASLATKMSTYKRGMFVETGDGNDVIFGTGYNDNINAGSGVNRIDGGANQGILPGGPNLSRDTLELTVNSTAEAQAVSITVLASTASGEDLAAFNDGYRYKIVSAATNETDYVKNVETLSIRIWNDANGNGQIDHHPDPSLSEVSTYRTRALGPTITDTTPTATTPSIGYLFGTQYKDTLSANNVLTALGKTVDPANPFGAFIFALGGNDVVTGSDGTDIALVTQKGSHRIDGGADSGYYNLTSGTPVASADQYRLVEQWAPTEVPTPSASNGGLTASHFQPGNYRLVNLEQWSGFATTSLGQMGASAAGDLINGLTQAALSEADVAAIAATATELGITGVAGDGYTMAVVKYDAGGQLLGVDFLKDIETVQFGLWYDSNRNDVPNGSAGETVTYATYTVAQDVFTLSAPHAGWLNAHLGGTTLSFAGTVSGTAAGEAIDASTVTVPDHFAAGTGFRVTDFGGNDTVTGSSGADLFTLGAGNDVVHGGAGVDTAAVYWRPNVSGGDASLSYSAVNLGGVTTITVSQTQGSVSTALFNLTNDGTDGNWTFQTTSTEANGLIRPSGTTNLGVGIDQLVNVESFAVYLQAGVSGIATGGVSTTSAFEIQLVGVPA